MATSNTRGLHYVIAAMAIALGVLALTSYMSNRALQSEVGALRSTVSSVQTKNHDLTVYAHALKNQYVGCRHNRNACARKPVTITEVVRGEAAPSPSPAPSPTATHSTKHQPKPHKTRQHQPRPSSSCVAQVTSVLCIGSGVNAHSRS